MSIIRRYCAICATQVIRSGTGEILPPAAPASAGRTREASAIGPAMLSPADLEPDLMVLALGGKIFSSAPGLLAELERRRG